MKTIKFNGEDIITLDDLEEVKVEVEGINNKLFIVNNSKSMNINIEIKPYSELIVLDFNLNNKRQIMEIVHDHDSKFEYYNGFRTDGEYNLSYKAIINGDNNENNIHLRGVSLDNNYISVDAVIKEHTKGNVINEDLRILNLGGHAYVSPMLHVSTLDVIANHNTAVSNIREDELFYLMSKGVSRDKCVELISDGYLYGLFKKEEDFYKRIIGG